MILQTEVKKKNQSKVSDNEIENPEWKYSNIGIVDALDRITGVLTEIKELIKKK